MLEALKRCKAQGVSISRCYITHSETGIETPVLQNYGMVFFDQLRNWIEEQGLDIEILISRPSVASSFHYQTIGRGVLPVFVEQSQRKCSVDWKITPQKRSIKAVLAASQNANSVIMINGSRFSESVEREKRMIARSDGPRSLVMQEGGYYNNSPLADWDYLDIWELLMSVDVNRKDGGLYSSFIPDFNWCHEIYKDSADGVCSVIVGESGPKSGCGSRTGCSMCLAVGSSDKSMSSMIETNPDAYSYLSGINDLRDYLHNTRNDYSLRDWIGREVSDANHVAIAPNNYSPKMRRKILRYMLTLDAIENERAAENDAKLFRGEISKSFENEMLSGPMFELVTPQMLVAIDMLWSTQYGFVGAFPALREWFEIHVEGKRYPIPPSQDLIKANMPDKRFYDVGEFVYSNGIEGLRDPECEELNKIHRPHDYPFKVYHDGERKNQVVPFEEAPMFSIDPADAVLLVTDDELVSELLRDTENLSTTASAKFWLDRKLVKPAKGRIRDFDLRCRKAQYWQNLCYEISGNRLIDYLLDNSISESEHQALINGCVKADTPKPQLELFVAA